MFCLAKNWTWLRPGGSPLNKRCILLPLNLNNNHWVLLVVLPDRRTILVLDSMNPVTTPSDRLHRKYKADVAALEMLLHAVELAEAGYKNRTERD